MNIFCRPLTHSQKDLHHLYNLKSLEKDIYWSGYIVTPDKINFTKWFYEQLTRTDRKIWLSFDCQDSKICLGYCYLTYQEEENCTIGNISIGVNENFAGNGIGSSMVNFIINIAHNNYLNTYLLRAWVLKENIKSVSCFKKNGFVKTTKTKMMFYKSFDENMLMNCYEYKINE